MKSVGLIIFFIFFVLPVFFFVRLIMKGVKATKADEWDGVVIDKLYNTKRDSENNKKIHQFYTVVVKTNKGIERKLAVTKDEYNTWQIGDKAKKIKGVLKVERIA